MILNLKVWQKQKHKVFVKTFVSMIWFYIHKDYVSASLRYGIELKGILTRPNRFLLKLSWLPN